jgi:hypothetical protein
MVLATLTSGMLACRGGKRILSGIVAPSSQTGFSPGDATSPKADREH